MHKRLIAVLAIAFVAALASGAYAEVQNVKVSGDITVIGAMRELNLDNDNQTSPADNDKDQFLAGITRVRIDADLTDNVSTTVRLINERIWGETISTEDNADIDIDLAYVTLKEFLYSPLTLTVGLQGLRFGNAMIIGDADTNGVAPAESIFALAQANQGDLSLRKAFEAIRATLNYDALTLDIVTAKIDEGNIASQDDTDLHGINANYKLDSNTILEGYYWLAYTARENGVVSWNKPVRIDTLGGRFVDTSIENVTIQGEAAIQFGEAAYNGDVEGMAKRQAWAAQAAATLVKPSMKYTPSFTGLYAFFSGNRGNSGEFTAWNPMFEDQSFGNIANAQFGSSNAHIIGVIGTMKPVDDIMLKGEYYAFWWDKRWGDQTPATTIRGDVLTMRDKKFAGSELDLSATYDYTEDVQFSLLSGIFFPGGSFDDANDNIATELIGSMKVTF